MSPATRAPAQREVLLTQARLAAELADHSVPATYDRERISAELALTREALHASAADLPALPEKRVVEPWA